MLDHDAVWDATDIAVRSLGRESIYDFAYEIWDTLSARTQRAYHGDPCVWIESKGAAGKVLRRALRWISETRNA